MERKTTLKIILLVFMFSTVLLVKSHTFPLKKSNIKGVFIDPHLFPLSQSHKITSTFNLYSLESFSSSSQIMVCSKAPLNHKKPFFKTKKCYWYVESTDKLPYFTSNPNVLSILKPMIYRYTLNHAIPFCSGNLSFYNSTPRNSFFLHGRKIDGSNVRVAIIDTGINPFSSWFSDANILYKGKVYYNSSTSLCEENTSLFYDLDGHGTHVAGIMHSVAPNASLIIINAYDYSIEGFTQQDLICAIKKALQLNASIISMSLGRFPFFTDCNETIDPLCAFISNISLTHPYVLFSIAAGNEGNMGHFENTINNKSVRLSYIKNSEESIYIFIRWYNISKNIDSIEMYNDSSMILRIFYNSSDYVIDYNSSPVEGYYGCDSNQCFLEYYLSDPSTSYSIYINTSGFDYDVYAFTGGLSPSNNYHTLSTPGINPFAFTVGSVVSYIYNNNYASANVGEISSFSSRGDVIINDTYRYNKPDVVAPGEQIYSASYIDNTSNGIILSGTSMATPFFAGVLALIKQILPSITSQEIKENISYITDSEAYSLSSFLPWEKGHGLINISKTINAMPVINVTSPIVSLYNTTISSINVSLNISVIKGHYRAKINDTTIPPNSYKIINISLPLPLNLTASNYTLNVSLKGEFLNSPYIENISLITFSNVSLEGLNIFKDNTTYNISLFLENRGFPAICNITLMNKSTVVLVSSTSEINFTSLYLNISSFLNNKIKLNCSNNIGKREYSIANISLLLGSSNITIFDNLSFNITHIKILFPFTAITYYVFIGNRTFSFYNLSSFNIEPALFMRNNTLEYNLSVIAEINSSNNEKYNVTIFRNHTIYVLLPFDISYMINKTNNQSFFGINSSFMINISCMFCNSTNLTYVFGFLNRSVNYTVNFTSASFYWRPNISDYIGREDFKAPFFIYLRYHNKTIILKNFSIILDLKPPMYVLKNIYSLQHIIIPLLVNESHLYTIDVDYNNTQKYILNYTQKYVLLNICRDTLINISFEDIAANIAKYTLNTSCKQIKEPLVSKYVYAISVLNDSFNTSHSFINITKEISHLTTKQENNKKKYTLNKSIQVVPLIKNVFIIINQTLPSLDYILKEVYMFKNNTLYNLTNMTYRVNNTIYLPLNLSHDPLISFIFYKENSIQKISSSHSYSSSGGGGFIISLPSNNTHLNTTKNSAMVNDSLPSWEIVNHTNNTLTLKINANTSFNITFYNISFEFSVNDSLSKTMFLNITVYKNKHLEIIFNTHKRALLKNISLTFPGYIICKNNTAEKICDFPLEIDHNTTLIIKRIEEKMQHEYNTTSPLPIEEPKITNTHHNQHFSSLRILLIVIGTFLIMLIIIIMIRFVF